MSFEVLPKLHQAVSSQGLAQAVAEHLEQTREHGPRLEQVFRAVGAEPSSNLDSSLEKLAQQHDELSGSFTDHRLGDVYHAASAVRTEHNEIAMYHALLVLGETLDLGDARGLLEQNRREEEEALERLEGELTRLVDDLSRS